MKRSFDQMNNVQKVYTINVGGKLYTLALPTSSGTTSEFILSKIGADNKDSLLDKDGNYYFDRDSKYFDKILNFIRTGNLNFSDLTYIQYLELKDELLYWKIDPVYKLNIEDPWLLGLPQDAEKGSWEVDIRIFLNNFLTSELFKDCTTQHGSFALFFQSYNDDIFSNSYNAITNEIDDVDDPFDIEDLLSEKKSKCKESEVEFINNIIQWNKYPMHKRNLQTKNYNFRSTKLKQVVKNFPNIHNFHPKFFNLYIQLLNNVKKIIRHYANDYLPNPLIDIICKYHQNPTFSAYDADNPIPTNIYDLKCTLIIWTEMISGLDLFVDDYSSKGVTKSKNLYLSYANQYYAQQYLAQHGLRCEFKKSPKTWKDELFRENSFHYPIHFTNSNFTNYKCTECELYNWKNSKDEDIDANYQHKSSSHKDLDLLYMEISW